MPDAGKFDVTNRRGMLFEIVADTKALTLAG